MTKIQVEKALLALKKAYAKAMQKLILADDKKKKAIITARLRAQGLRYPKFPWKFCANCHHSEMRHIDMSNGEAVKCGYSSCSRGCCDTCDCTKLVYK